MRIHRVYRVDVKDKPSCVYNDKAIRLIYKIGTYTCYDKRLVEKAN